MPLLQWGDEVHVPQSLKGRICAAETLLARAGLPFDPIILHPCPWTALTAFSSPYTHTHTLTLTFFKRVHLWLSHAKHLYPSMVRPVALPITAPHIMVALPTFYPPLPKGALASKVSMHDFQEGLAPPHHCRQTTGKKGEIFPPAGSAFVKTGERGKGKCDLHWAISDCPSWESKLEWFSKQAFILTSSIYWLYHIGLYKYFMHSPLSPLLPPFICYIYLLKRTY